METVQIAGAAIILAGLTIALWCVIMFAVIGWGTPLPFAPPRRLVLTGPYRFVRHPGYLGAILGALATPLVLGSAWLVVSTLFAFLSRNWMSWLKSLAQRETEQTQDLLVARY